MLWDIEKLGLSEGEQRSLIRLLESECISLPIVLRDHRKRGPVYWSLIFDAAKNAPAIFGLAPLKMINFKGIYLVDSDDYAQKLAQIAEKIKSAGFLAGFSSAKGRVDSDLNDLVRELKVAKFASLPGKSLASSLKKFYGTRYLYTQYSFFFDTITKSLDLVLQNLFLSTGFSASERELAYIPDFDSVEFLYFEAKESFLKKHARELAESSLNKGRVSPGLLEDLNALMDEFADLNFVNFETPLQSKKAFTKKLLSHNSLGKSISRLKELRPKKQALLMCMLPLAAEKGIKPEFVEALFDFAGKLSAWESNARQSWTRLHRTVKPLIDEIGKRAAAEGLLQRSGQIYNLEIMKIIKMAEKLPST